MQPKKGNRMEPFYTMVNDRDHFRILCTTLDEQNVCMRDDILVIEKKGCKIFSRKKQQSDEEGGIQYPNHGIVGILNISQNLFLVIITERQLVAKMPSGDFVYEINGVDCIPFEGNVFYN
jgi:hypothetical protein